MTQSHKTLVAAPKTPREEMADKVVDLLASYGLDEQFIIVNMARTEIRRRQMSGVAPVWTGPILRPKEKKKTSTAEKGK